MSRKSCVIYDSWAYQIMSLPTDMAGELSQKIFRYAICGEEVSFDNPALGAMFVSIKMRLDEDLEKYQAQVDRAKALSKRGHNEVDTKSIRSRNEVGGVNVNVNENVNDKNIKKKANFHNFPERNLDFEKLRAKDV